MSEQLLFDTQQFPGMEGRALGPGILDNFAGHFHEEHEPIIRAWLNKRQARD
jgi:hypothetical protein